MASNREELIRYTEHKILEVERPKDIGLGLDTQFDSPKCPMLVVNMSSTLSEDRIYQIESDLFSIWPRYREVIPFVSDYKQADYKAVVEKLMDYNNNFAKYTYVILYFVVDTSEFKSKDEFYAKLHEIEQIKAQVAGYASPKCLLFLLYSANAPVSEELRAVLKDLYAEEHFGLDMVVVVSNQLSIGAYVSDDRERIRELTTIILLSNAVGAGGANPITLNEFKVVTLRLHHQEKPYSDISKVIITRIFLRIQELIATKNPIFVESEFLKMIGVNSVTHFFDLFEKSVGNQIIEEAELDYFPMKDPDANYDLNLLSYDDFNSMCFGTLEAYLQRKIRNSEFYDPVKKERLEQEYRDFLYQNFTLWDLKAMMGKVGHLRRMYEEGINTDNTSNGVLEAFEFKYKTGISTDPEFYSVFFDAIQKLCDDAEVYSNSLNKLIGEIASMQPVQDKELREYYQRITDDYINTNPKVIEDLLRVDILQQADFEGAFIKKIEELIDRIITSNSQIFSLPFVLALVKLWGTAPVNEIANAIARSDNMRLYFRPQVGTTGDLDTIFGNPVLLINQDGPLKNIIDTKQFNVLNTMSDSFIEKIDVLEIKEGNI